MINVESSLFIIWRARLTAWSQDVLFGIWVFWRIYVLGTIFSDCLTIEQTCIYSRVLKKAGRNAWMMRACYDNRQTLDIVAWSSSIAFPYVHDRASSHAIVAAIIELSSSSSNSTCYSISSTRWIIYKREHLPEDIHLSATKKMKIKPRIYLWNHKIKWPKTSPFRSYACSCIKADCTVSAN